MSAIGALSAKFESFQQKNYLKFLSTDTDSKKSGIDSKTEIHWSQDERFKRSPECNNRSDFYKTLNKKEKRNFKLWQKNQITNAHKKGSLGIRLFFDDKDDKKVQLLEKDLKNISTPERLPLLSFTQLIEGAAIPTAKMGADYAFIPSSTMVPGVFTVLDHKETPVIVRGKKNLESNDWDFSQGTFPEDLKAAKDVKEIAQCAQTFDALRKPNSYLDEETFAAKMAEFRDYKNPARRTTKYFFLQFLQKQGLNPLDEKAIDDEKLKTYEKTIGKCSDKTQQIMFRRSIKKLLGMSVKERKKYFERALLKPTKAKKIQWCNEQIAWVNSLNAYVGIHVPQTQFGIQQARAISDFYYEKMGYRLPTFTYNETTGELSAFKFSRTFKIGWWFKKSFRRKNSA